MPVKPVSAAKSRLASLPASRREEFARAFTRDALTAVLVSPLVAQVILVGDTTDAPDDPRCVALADPHADLTRAIDVGLATLAPEDPAAVIVCDLPALRPAEITVALTHSHGHRLSMICDRVGTGTTMLISPQRRDLRHRFGHRSRAAHAALGATDLAHLQVPGLRCDVDTEVDLWDAHRLGVGANTRVLLDQ